MCHGAKPTQMRPTLRLAINSYNGCSKLIQSGFDGRYHINAILANQIFQDLHCIVCNFKLGFLNRIIDFLLNLIQITRPYIDFLTKSDSTRGRKSMAHAHTCSPYVSAAVMRP